MKRPNRFWNYALAFALLMATASSSHAKGYSSGGHSYSSSSHSSSSHSSSGGHSSSFSSGSHSSGSTASKSSSSATHVIHTSPSGPSKSFSPGTGRSYGSGSTWSDENRKSYSSGKSYSAGAETQFSTKQPPSPALSPKTGKGEHSGSFAFDTAAARARKEEASKQEFTHFKEASKPADSRPLTPKKGEGEHSGSFAFDTAAARARKEEGSKQEFARFKEASKPRDSIPSPNRTDGNAASSYQVKPPPLLPSATGSYRGRTYVLDDYTLATRPARVQTLFYPYISRPVVVYRDPYNSFFWWWLLDRSLDDRGYWAYHHRYDMDPARYDALVAHDRDLEGRISQLEAQQLPRNPNYAPTNIDRDLMYSDQYVARTYTNRPTTSGSVVFWLFAIPAATATAAFFIWLIFFKRWQVSTA